LNCRYFYASNDAKSLALAVVHIDKEANNAVLLDIIENNCDEKTLTSLVISIVNFCNKRRLKHITATMLNQKLHKILRKVGFSHSKSNFGLMVYADEKSVKNKLAVAENWDYWIGHSDVY
jgi:hypothetical protein